MRLERIVFLLSILFTLVFTSMATAFAVVIPPGTKLADKQVLMYHLSSTPETLDPGINVDWGSQQRMKSLFDTLVRQDYTGKLVGVAASSWDVSPDGLVWTFHLRPNATWTDGKTVTASDFVYAWRRVLDPKTASLGSDLFLSTNIKNAIAVRDGKLPVTALGVKALNELTLQLTLSEPTPWLLQTLTFLNTAPVRQDIIEKYGHAWTRPEHIVSNGPYKLVANNFNESLILKKRADYWDAKNIYITEIKYLVSRDPNATYYHYLAGDFYTSRIPSQFLDIIKKERPQEIISEPYPSTYMIVLNTRLPKFQDVRVHQAMSYLLDRKFISEKLYKAYSPTTIVTPPILEDGQAQTEDQYTLDDKYKVQREAKARSLLQLAGYTVDNPLEITWSYQKSRDADRNNIALAGMLEDFSHHLIKVTFKALDKNTYYTNIAKHNFDVIYYIMNSDYYHASSFFKVFRPEQVNNFSGWTDPAYIKLYDQSTKVKTAAERQAIYEKLNLMLQQQVPVIPIMLSARFILKSPALGAFNGKLPFTYLRDYYIIADKHIVKP